ncbi:hypothetical protein M409DRAFT_71582 [Zasmidium cellare ATCC 36951]|uniref:U3 small nucleolar RNA-associated protein 11 n=1 Tax=Zasmidium cellare ATCC 36951 TaxID=1080233 RepID=A0A6A6BYD2_ZASCE|nr:uncharacterized protein M409DRAFT_71582 [Zasmidium cellare ATCC 36951]KAF2158572.1 hypothetical protein M409DRAFT_71582 [Zasmidium cellare ATCC 36951]
MSSMRNAVQRRNHRERAQPTERSKWGLLEKRKDYKLRATDHKTKQAKISALKAKASERNEDEFYFGMMQGKDRRQQRAEGSGGGRSLDQEVVRLMKTQDVGYLRTMLQRVRRERERVGRDVVAGGVGVEVLPEAVVGGGRKVVFGEDGEVLEPVGERGGDEEGVDEMDLDDLAGLGGSEGEEEESEEEDENLTPEEREARRKKRHLLDVKRRKLDALKDQEEKLSAALDEVEEQRAKMNGSIGGVNKSGVKFKPRQRKR